MYTSVHTTSFEDLLLLPELLRAISNCGFEHPSEGRPEPNIRPPSVSFQAALAATG